MSRAVIEFVRVERDCIHNKEIRSKGESRKIIYDLQIMIDGEHRATWHNSGFAQHKYWLQHADWALSWARKPNGVIVKIPNLKNVEEDTRAVIEYIPTSEQIAALLQELARKAEERESKESELKRLRYIHEAAPELLAALKHRIEHDVLEGSVNAMHPSRRFCRVCGLNSKVDVHAAYCPVLIAELAIAKAEPPLG